MLRFNDVGAAGAWPAAWGQQPGASGEEDVRLTVHCRRRFLPVGVSNTTVSFI